MATVRIKDTRHRDVIELLQGGSMHAAVGVLARDAGASKGDGVTVIEAATYNEFGTEDIPARPVLRDTVDRNDAAYRREARKLAVAVLDGRLSLETAHNRLGILVAGDIKQAIADGVDPPNAESTIRRKGSSKPLIASGQFRRSVNHEVRR